MRGRGIWTGPAFLTDIVLALLTAGGRGTANVDSGAGCEAKMVIMFSESGGGQAGTGGCQDAGGNSRAAGAAEFGRTRVEGNGEEKEACSRWAGGKDPEDEGESGRRIDGSSWGWADAGVDGRGGLGRGGSDGAEARGR